MGVRVLALIGMRGAGKTRVGALLAERLSMPFVDLDRELALAAGARSAGDVLARVGEPAFRELEGRTLARVVESPEPLVLATGGGSVEHPFVRNLLERRATCLWLRVEVDVLRRRIAADRTHRPALGGGDALEELEGLAQRRDPLYAELADVALECGEASVDELVERLRALLA